MARKKKADGAAKEPEKRVLKDHNGGMTQQTLLRHVGAIRKLTEDKDKAVAKIRAARKQAKDDGVDLKMLDRVMAEQAMTSDELIEHHNKLVAYRRFMSMPIGTQMSFLDAVEGELTPERIKAEAKSEGEQAGLRGEGVDKNPHDPNSDAGRAWLDGQEIGQQKMRDAMEFKMNANNAASKETALA